MNWYQRVWQYVDVSYNSAATTIINRHLPTPLRRRSLRRTGLRRGVPPISVPVGGGNSCSGLSFMRWARARVDSIAGLDIGVDIFYETFTAYKAGQHLSATARSQPCRHL
jgi:hypothetical protein